MSSQDSTRLPADHPVAKEINNTSSELEKAETALVSFIENFFQNLGPDTEWKQVVITEQLRGVLKIATTVFLTIEDYSAEKRDAQVKRVDKIVLSFANIFVERVGPVGFVKMDNGGLTEQMREIGKLFEAFEREKEFYELTHTREGLRWGASQ